MIANETVVNCKDCAQLLYNGNDGDDCIDNKNENENNVMYYM